MARALGFLLLPLFTRYLSPEDYGIIALLSWLGIVVNPLVSLGLGAGLAPQYFRRDFEGRRQEVTWTALWLIAGAALGTLVLVFLAGGAIDGWLGVPPRIRHGFFLGVSALAAGALLVPLQGNLQFSGRARAFTTVSLVSAGATLGLAVILVVVMKRGVEGWFEAMLGGQIAGVAIAAFLNRSLGGPRWNPSMARGLVMSGLALMPTSFLVFALQHGNKWLLQAHRGLAELGLYNVALSIALLMNLVVMSIQSAWFPAIMARRDQPEEALASNTRMLLRLALALGVLNLLLGAGARPIVTLMTAPAFHSAYRLVALAANAHVWAGLFYVGIIPLYFEGRENAQTVILAAAVVVYGGLSFWLVPLLGGLGCAVATVAGFAGAAFAALGYTCTLQPRLGSLVRALAPRWAAVFALWLLGGALLAFESWRPGAAPWLSAAVCLGAPVAGWRMLADDERAAALAAVRRAGRWRGKTVAPAD